MTGTTERILWLSLTLLGGLIACSSSRTESPAPGEQSMKEPVKPKAPLEDTYWRLTALGGRPVLVPDKMEAPHFILNAAKSGVGGSTGCNQFSGSYRLSGDSLRFDRLISTLRACVDPELNRQERVFLDALGATRRWRITSDSLELFGKAGTVARFGAQ